MKNELAFETAEACFKVAELLLTDGHYVVLVSREEHLWILNYEYSDFRNRNDVIFMDRCEFEQEYYGSKNFSES